MEYLGKIIRVVPECEGKHGAYAVVTISGFEGSVTFSLNPEDNVWQEDYTLVHEKHCNLWVVLSKLARKDPGWRAMSARAYSPDDDDNENLLGRWE